LAPAGLGLNSSLVRAHVFIASVSPQWGTLGFWLEFVVGPSGYIAGFLELV
jgi:hypothetical protein